MTASRVRWLVIFLIYGLFHWWYGGNGDPMTREQVEHYAARAATQLDSKMVPRIRKLAETDDGKEFVMVNLNQYREQPEYADGRDQNLTPQEVEQKYIGSALKLLLVRACHPLLVVDPVLNMPGEGKFERIQWDRISIARYRSRTDFLEFILDPDFNSGVEHKWAALDKTHTLMTVPQVWFVAIRLVPFLLLVCLGLILDRIFHEKDSKQEAT